MTLGSIVAVSCCLLIQVLGTNKYLSRVILSVERGSIVYVSYVFVSNTHDTEFYFQPIVYIGFTIWAIGCGCLSTITNHSPKPLLVWFMLMAGTGAGGVSALRYENLSVQRLTQSADIANNDGGCAG
jgi:hypothetical protein